MNTNIVNEVTARQLKKDVPEFSSGDTVKVSVRIIENKKERIQVFQGVVIQRRGSGVSETFTVRKISSGVGVERTFPILIFLIEFIQLEWNFFKLYNTISLTSKFHNYLFFPPFFLPHAILFTFLPCKVICYYCRS